MEPYIESTRLTVFLFGVFFISFTGAMMPGPVSAAAIVKGQNSGKAGVGVALGHGLVEIPLIVAIALGLSRIFKLPAWKITIGILGGAVLMGMGYEMIRDRAELGAGRKETPFGSFQAGAATTVSNPYFFLWWGTVGGVFITKSLEWGPLGVILLVIVHWSVDLGWNWLLSSMSHRGKQIMNRKVQAGVFAVCGIVLVAFGLFFILDGSGLLRVLARKLA